MRRRLLAAGGFALLAAPVLTLAQPAGVNKSPPGYLVIRVSLGGVGAPTVPQGGEGGGAGGEDGGGGAPGPGGGGRGGGGRGGGGGGFPGAGGPPADGSDPSRSVVVVVPYTRAEGRAAVYKSQAVGPMNPNVFIKVTGPAGTAFLLNDADKIVVQPLRGGYYLPAVVEKKHSDWTRQRSLPEGKALVDEALSFGLPKLAVQYAAEVCDAAARRKDTPPPATAAFVTAFTALKDALPKPLPANPEAAEWQSRLGAQVVAESEHYALVHYGEGSLPKDAVERRLSALENNFKAFYLWHALAGEALPLPAKKLVVLVADRGSDMPKLRDAIDGNAITESISDAFYSPTHNLVVLSPERQDALGKSWHNFVSGVYQKGFNRDELLKGTPPAAKAGESSLEVARATTYALVDRLVDEEAVTAMVSREGSRQLFAATNKLNPYVILPEWVETGVSNLLNKPKGPYFHTVGGAQKMTVGLKSGYGAPNYVLVREFDKMRQAKELHPKSDELLTNVLTDRYFDAWRDGKDIDPPPAPAGGGGLALGGGPGDGPGSGAAPGGGGGRGGPGGGRGGPGGGPGSPDGGGEGGMGIGGSPGAGGGGPAQDQQADARKLKQKLLIKSQATAWGLTHFLAKSRSAGLSKFFDQLSRMPRDLRPDREQMLLLFCREFGLMDRRDPTKVNKDEFKRLADDWLDFMRGYANEGGLDLDVGGQPGGGGFPGGGFPGGGGSGEGGGRG